MALIWDVRVLWNPLRPFIQNRNSNIIKKFVREELEKRLSEMRDQGFTATKKAHSVTSLALEGYLREKKTSGVLTVGEMDQDFVDLVTNQIRLFLFAGNDTTASTVAFAFHMLSQHPDARERVKHEHNTVFSLHVPDAARLLKERPSLLHQCTYTNAFIKETLRLYPPAANVRRGQPGHSLTALNGQCLPTDGFNIIVVQQTVHQNPRIWARPSEFLPERWLVGPEHELYPPQNGYRPWDTGSRTCIGKPLALAELKVILVLCARSFTVDPAYEEWDKLQEEKRGLWGKFCDWLLGEEIKTVNGNRAYQSEKAGTHPADGYPCRVALVKDAST
jgi:hypothetical protein